MSKQPVPEKEKATTSATTAAAAKTTATPSKQTGQASKSGQGGQKKSASSPGKAMPQNAAGAKKKKERLLMPIEELLGPLVVNAAGDKVSPQTFVVENGIIGLYFAASWCPPCRKLYPQLMLLYEEVRKAGHLFEMVFVSYDHDVQSFNRYLAKMPWWAVDHDDEERRENLGVTFQASGIPLFLILDANTQEVICREGVFCVSTDPKGSNFPWKDTKVPNLEVNVKDFLLELIASAQAITAELAQKEISADGQELELIDAPEANNPNDDEAKPGGSNPATAKPDDA